MPSTSSNGADIVKDKCAYAIETYCASEWRENPRSMRRVGIVADGVTEHNCSDQLSGKELGLRVAGQIGVPRDVVRHQSPFCRVGNKAISFCEEDIVGGKSLKVGDVVVYDLDFVRSSKDNLGILIARKIIRIRKRRKYDGKDPIATNKLLQTFVEDCDPRSVGNSGKVVNRAQYVDDVHGLRMGGSLRWHRKKTGLE